MSERSECLSSSTGDARFIATSVLVHGNFPGREGPEDSAWAGDLPVIDLR